MSHIFCTDDFLTTGLWSESIPVEIEFRVVIQIGIHIIEKRDCQSGLIGSYIIILNTSSEIADLSIYFIFYIVFVKIVYSLLVTQIIKFCFTDGDRINVMA